MVLRPALVVFVAVWLCYFSKPVAAQFFDEVEGDESGYSRLVVDDEKYGYFLTSAKWQTNPIRVCWETLDPAHELDRKLVRDSINESWARHSALKFTGWGQCPSSSFTGIMIRVVNMKVQVVGGLGAQISGRRPGMILNFTLTHSPEIRPCNTNRPTRELCIKSQAVHEFGHAIGFDHEHNRMDRDEDCAKARTAEVEAKPLTPYDPESVMNYCNPEWNRGKLSQLDILALQTAYGAP